MSTPLRKHRSGEREQILYIFYPLENFDLNVYYLSIAAKKKKKILNCGSEYWKQLSWWFQFSFS